MALNTKTIKRRIKSISSTKKITKAMEMISAVKMRRAVANVLATRNYSTLAWTMLQEIAKKTNLTAHPLLQKREVKKVAVVLITSNRGLAGGFSSRLLQEVHNFIKSQPTVISNEREKSLAHNIDVDVILTGKRGKKIYQKFGHTVVAEFDKLDLTTKVDEILPMAQMVVKDYVEGKYDQVVVAYMDFKSAIQQTPKIKQLLPLSEDNDSTKTLPLSEEEYKRGYFEDYDDQPTNFGLTFEPTPKEVLEVLLPRLIEMQMYQAVLESDASEHSARMLSMRNASDAANDMIKELNYSFNKARQAAITREIAEIVGGAAALG